MLTPPGPPLPPHVIPPADELPVGTVISYAGPLQATTPSPPPGGPVPQNTAPFGWLPCNGQALEQGRYPELYAVLGTVWGGSGSTFNLPDFRGTFLRGVDGGAGNDPDVADRTPLGSGSPDDVGSSQLCAMQTHQHGYTPPVAGPGGAGSGAGVGPEQLTGPPTSDPTPPGNVLVSQHETRPRNLTVNFLIKYAYLRRPGAGPRR